MRKLSQIFQADLKSSDKHPYKRYTKEIHTEKKGGRVTMVAEIGKRQPQAQEYRQPLEAERGKGLVLS